MKPVIFLCLMFISLAVAGQQKINYEEDSIPPYLLPDPLLLENGKPVRSVQQWERKQRPRILHLFEDRVYGKQPRHTGQFRYKVMEEESEIPEGKGRRKQVEIILMKKERELTLTLLMYLPAGGDRVPLFLGYNFNGNHTVTTDESVLISGTWIKLNANPGDSAGSREVVAPVRGEQASGWPVQTILDAGFGVATLWYGDVDPDRNDFTDGVHALTCGKGEEKPGDGEWGSLAAWAWGLSRVLDYLETDPAVDATRVAVLGHSRLGKAALWAGATDRRFAMVISNESGCGGAALSRRKFGETVWRINTSFPHWFCGNFKAYNNREEFLPVDQHELIALIAPRPVYIASALKDQWADPVGEYLAGYHASPVYRLYGKTGLDSPFQPPVNQAVMNQIGYHIREGDHDLKEFDWKQFIRFAGLHFYHKNM